MQASRSSRLVGLPMILCAIGLAPTLSPAQQVEVCLSSKAGDRLAFKEPLHFQAAGKDGADFRIDPSSRHQKMDGFGASFLEAGMVCLRDLSKDQQEAVFRALFDPEAGAGFSAMKTAIAGTDFMSAGPWYTYDDVPGDVDLKHFSIERDLGPTGLVTYIKRAGRYGKFMLQAPMDYPPDWMLVDVNKNQDVSPEHHDALARYFLRYLQEYQKQGIFIDYLSLFNEPGNYTKIKYDPIRHLIADHVGPLLRKEGVKTRIQLSEASTRDGAFKQYPTVLDDPAARKYVACIPYHGYGFTHFDKIVRLREKYPDLPLWMTEICHAYQAGTPKSMKLPRTDFEDGDFWGNQIVSDLEAGASAWIYWNMILDQEGGPCLVSEIHGNPPNNVQHPVVIIDRKAKKVTYTGLYYYLAHFGRFVRPGSVRIGTTGTQEGVRCIAFATGGQGGDPRIVVQLMNRGNADAETRIEWRGQSLPVKLPALSITTCRWSASGDSNSGSK